MEMIGCAAILLVIGCFVFKKMYDLDENKMTAIRNEILERKL
jgi:dsRNA-specific ribonuclease